MSTESMVTQAEKRFHVEGQTSTLGPRWQIWDGEQHFARFRNIADRTDADNLCDALNEGHRTAAQPEREAANFQTGVDRWMDACFGEPIKSDHLERADRLTEEALELVQTVPGFTADRAHALVDYVFGRPVGERGQEVGGTMVCLAALCNTFGISIKEEAERELARIWTKVEQIRAKQAAKPTGSALPIAPEPTDAELLDQVCRGMEEVSKPLEGRDGCP